MKLSILTTSTSNAPDDLKDLFQRKLGKENFAKRKCCAYINWSHTKSMTDINTRP